MKFASDPFMYTEYYAPRGRKRLLELGNTITSQYLSPEDRCIGILGEAGSGKSLIVRGMFPGLQLTNDDEDVYTRPLPLMDHFESGRFRDHTYHMDVRFESAFTQMHELADAIKKTQKRANALKNIMIPRFEETVKFITDALEEKEREEFSRLKVIKSQKNAKAAK